MSNKPTKKILSINSHRENAKQNHHLLTLSNIPLQNVSNKGERFPFEKKQQQSCKLFFSWYDEMFVCFQEANMQICSIRVLDLALIKVKNKYI